MIQSYQTYCRPEDKPKIIVGLSGGVDSSVSAYLLKQEGYTVEGLFMKNWQDDDNCPAAADLLDAQRICDRVDIPLHTVNFSQEYWHHVFDHFLKEYAAGRTPNPDVLCNKEIKFKAFLDYAKTLGGDFIATGHYASISGGPDTDYQLLCSADRNKDQTYFLYTLGQEQLRQSVFPVGHLDKKAVRALASSAGLITHNKKDSTGICFIGERKFRDFLNRYLPAKPGLIKSLEGNVVGEHQGVMYYTRGQRQGLGIGGLKETAELPWYVADKDVDENILYVVQGHEHPALYHVGLICQQMHWVSGAREMALPGTCQAKVRYRQSAQNCTLLPCADDSYRVIFEQAQWAITPGQSVVFYQDEVCLGGGIIVQELSSADYST